MQLRPRRGRKGRIKVQARRTRTTRLARQPRGEEKCEDANEAEVPVILEVHQAAPAPPCSRAYRLDFLLNAEESKTEDNLFVRDVQQYDGNHTDEYEFRFGEVDENSHQSDSDMSVLEQGFTSTSPTQDEQMPSNARSGTTNRWIGGYQYTRADTKVHKIYYRCSYYRSSGCKGKCHFVFSLQQYTNFTPHSCGRCAIPASDNGYGPSREVDVSEAMKKEVDHLAITTTANRGVIWDIVRAKFYGAQDTSVAYAGLSREAVLRRVNRTRSDEFGGSVYGQIEVPPWSQILAYDGWGHPVLVNMLKQKKTNVFVDGTFRSVPRQFRQCVIFSTYDRPSRAYFPTAFVLCTSKNYTTYFHAMRLVLDETDYAMDPEFVYCDFEAGLIRSIRDHFSDALPVGCLFHFKQACKRKMQVCGITEPEYSIAMKPGVLDMLTVIKQHQVKKQGIKWVKAKIEQSCAAQGVRVSSEGWLKFWKYFQKTWIVRFPPALWNIEPISKAVVSRTNNPLERFNREMNDAFPAPHPNLPDFVVGIEKLARRYANLKTDIDLGRARAHARWPIQIPKAVPLPEADSSDEEDANGNSGEDTVSDADSDTDLIRSDPRSLVRTRVHDLVSVSSSRPEPPTNDETRRNYYDDLID